MAMTVEGNNVAVVWFYERNDVARSAKDVETVDEVILLCSE